MHTMKEMKSLSFRLLTLLLLATIGSSCNDVIDLQVENNDPKLVVEAQLTNTASLQTVNLTESQAYFNNGPRPVNIATGATVNVTDTKGNVFVFEQSKDKEGKLTQAYTYNSSKVFGVVGETYTLNITYKGQSYKASSVLRPVPKIDSLNYFFTKATPNPGAPTDALKEGFQVEFFARDFKGIGDCYYLRGISYSKTKKEWDPTGFQTIYDAAFAPGSKTDNLTFILPIRRAISTGLLAEGDSIRVDLRSTTFEHYEFLRSAITETNNQGLFATPPATIPTNVKNVNANGPKAMGFFNISGQSVLQTVIDAKKAVPNPDKAGQ
jgi:hypothetical protein